MNNTCLLSIRCFVYNHEPYLRQCLDGFVMQKTSFAFEAIVHDDASTDSSAAIIREYADKYPEIIKPIYETENQYSRHDGTLRRIMDSAISSSSKYVAICEGDDYWIDPYKLQKQVDALEAHPECSICFGKVKVVSEKGDYLGWSIPVNNNLEGGLIDLAVYTYEQFRKTRWTFQTSGYLYRSHLGRTISSVMQNEFSSFPYGDTPLVLICLMNGNGYYIDEELSCYRWQSIGSWSEKNANIISFKINVSKKLINGLIAFDQMTSYKYHSNVKIKIRQQEYLVEDYSHHEWNLLLPKYWCIYNRYTLKHTFSVLLKKYSPSLWKSLKK